MKSLEILGRDLKSWQIRVTRPLKRVFLELTNRCNLRCSFCYNPNKRDELPTDVLLAAIRSVHAHYGNSVAIALSGGEPTLHPGFFDLTRELADKGFTWTLSTNGTLLGEHTVSAILDQGCMAVALSLDAGPELHDRIRKGRDAFASTMRTLARFYPHVGPFELYVTTTVTKDNVHDLPRLAEALAPFPRVRWRINPVKMPATRMADWMDEATYSAMVAFYLEQRATDRWVKFGETSRLSHKYGEYLTDELDKCNAGATVFGLVANGDVVTCMVNRDQVLGNVLGGGDLVTIWREAQISFCRNLCDKHFNHQTR